MQGKRLIYSYPPFVWIAIWANLSAERTEAVRIAHDVPGNNLHPLPVAPAQDRTVAA